MERHVATWQPLLDFVGGHGRLRRLTAALDANELDEAVYYITCFFAQPSAYHVVFLRALAAVLSQRAAPDERRLGQARGQGFVKWLRDCLSSRPKPVHCWTKPR
eukprot:4684582-Pyramimonas_sp.AAC.1